MARNPRYVDLAGLTQKELLPILDRPGTYMGDDMIVALETAPGLDALADTEAAYRESHLGFLRIEHAKHVLGEFVEAHGSGPFTMTDFLANVIRAVKQRTRQEFDGDALDAADEAARPMFKAHFDILERQSIIEHLGEGVYRIRIDS